MHEALSVPPCIIGGSPHRGKIVPRLGAFKGSAGKFFVGQLDIIFAQSPLHNLKKIRADLMAEPTGACVDHHRDLIFKKGQGICGLFVVYLIDILNLEKVIAGTERSLLCSPPLVCLLTYEIRVRSIDTAAGLDPIEVRGVSDALFDSPSSAFNEEFPFVSCVETDSSL